MVWSGGAWLGGRGAVRLGTARRGGAGNGTAGVIRLGVAGVVAGFEIDTSHFTGNYPPGAEIEVCRSDAESPEDGWVKVEV